MDTELIEQIEELDEIEYLDGVVSECCGAPITETGFCSECGEHAI